MEKNNLDKAKNNSCITRVYVFLFSLILSLNSNAQEALSIDDLFSKQLEYSMISKGDNFPDFWIKNDSLDLLLFSLHENIPLTLFGSKTNFSDIKIKNSLSFLESKGWVHIIDGQYKPTVFIASAKDGEKIYEYATPISQDITVAIKKVLPQIKKQFAKTHAAKSSNFERWSFLILSNVLLDNWQINNVERNFIKQENRPLRHGKNYYYSILENTDKSREAFGIYGNQQMMTADKSTLSIYGNNRHENKQENYSNIISKKDNAILEEMATLFLPELLIVLENHRAYSEEVYHKLGYSSEITFEEFYIWFYHFIYTQSTNQLATQQILEIPKSGNFYYHIYH